MTRPVVVLGATGSIGSQTIEVATSLGLEIAALAARSPSAEARGIGVGPPERAGSGGGWILRGARGFRRASSGGPVEFGAEAVIDAARIPGTVVVNGIVGAAGLRATIAGLESGNRVALANKESLVAGGPVVKRALAEHGGELIPVDSEHSALLQCLAGEEPESVARLILTASGGPFRGRSADSLVGVTPDEALAHPTWDMGPRITIDSATLFNKGLEVIEAHHLFDIDYDRIAVLIHPQSHPPFGGRVRRRVVEGPPRPARHADPDPVRPDLIRSGHLRWRAPSTWPGWTSRSKLRIRCRSLPWTWLSRQAVKVDPLPPCSTRPMR